MKAAILKTLDTPLSVETVADPVMGTGEVLVDVVAAPVLSYADEVFSGKRQYLIELPMIPGCGAIGRIHRTGPDATHLKAGDWVFCDPTVRGRDNVLAPDITLQGWSARGEGGLRLQRYHHDGPFAERVRIPTENACPLPALEPLQAAAWCPLGLLLIPYGGLLAAGFAPGQTLVVSGATGNFGSATVMLALAMGAACVVAPGRNPHVLDELVRRFGERVRPVRLTGDEEQDTRRIREAASCPIDCVLDILPPSVPATAVRAAVMSVRPLGQVVLMGGVGMLGGAGLELPYPWIMRNNITIRGQWMYPPQAVHTLVGMVRAGLLDLAEFDLTRFPLDEANRAVEHAAANSRAFRMTVITP